MVEYDDDFVAFVLVLALKSRVEEEMMELMMHQSYISSLFVESNSTLSPKSDG